MTGYNLPPGCTQRDIDEAMGEYEEECLDCGKPLHKCRCNDEPDEVGEWSRADVVIVLLFLLLTASCMSWTAHCADQAVRTYFHEVTR